MAAATRLTAVAEPLREGEPCRLAGAYLALMAHYFCRRR